MDNKDKVKQDRNFVSCEQKYELDYIKRKLKKEYPALKSTKIDEALKTCCREVPPPRPREKYMECMKKKLNITDAGVKREKKLMRLPKQTAPVMKSGIVRSIESGINPSCNVSCYLECAGTSALKCLGCGKYCPCYVGCGGVPVAACARKCGCCIPY